MIDLAFIWAALIAFAVLAYVLFDGFDLGIGILFPFLADDDERDVAMNSVAPVWDGNETWLVLGGGGLMAAFPLAYAVVMPALYVPIILMLLGLIFRGVAFEFRWRTERGKTPWDWAFAGGSTVAALAQGIALGALVQGIPVANRAYAGGWWDWLTWFSMLTGRRACRGLRAAGLDLARAEDDGRASVPRARLRLDDRLGNARPDRPRQPHHAVPRPCLHAALVCLACHHLLGAGADLRGASRAGLVLGAAHGARGDAVLRCNRAVRALLRGASASASIRTSCRPRSRIWDAAAPDNSLRFLLVGAVVLIPLILGYTALAYWVFRGKVDPKAGYH